MMWLLPICSAIFLWLSFESRFLTAFALVGLIPFFIFFQKNGFKKSFLGGWLYGSIFFALIMKWLLSAWPADWAGIDNVYLAIPLFGIIWLGLSIFSGLAFGFFGLLTKFIFNNSRGRFGDLLIFIALPCAWIISEYSRAWLFSLFFWSQEAAIGPYWSFGNLGYALINTPFIFWSRFIGLYGLSFLIAMANVWLFFIFFRQSKLISSRFIAVFSATVIAIAAVLFINNFFLRLPPQTPEEYFNVSLFSTNSSFNTGYFNTDDFLLIWRETQKNRELLQPDIVIFPENSQLFGETNEKEKTLLDEIFPDKNRRGLLISNFIPIDFNDRGSKSKIIYRDQKGNLIDAQEKSFLVPAGEYIPAIIQFFVKLTGDEKILQQFQTTRSFRRGENQEKPIAFSSTKIGTLLCSGVIAPTIYRSLTANGAEILVNAASLSIFKGNRFLLSQLETQARFNAIANGKPLLQAANSGESLFINRDGEIISKIGVGENTVLNAKVAPSKAKTFFTKWGDWPIPAAFLILLIIALPLLLTSRLSTTARSGRPGQDG